MSRLLTCDKLWLQVLMELCMWATAAMDPGIVPRDPYPIDVNPDTLLVRDGVQFKWYLICSLSRSHTLITIIIWLG